MPSFSKTDSAAAAQLACLLVGTMPPKFSGRNALRRKMALTYAEAIPSVCGSDTEYIYVESFTSVHSPSRDIGETFNTL
ncbi:hypothetical protein PoB_001222000 [Plakobranchus ocellatus]|uniref:Uncharacterized protein n=1 Tax=Plakobranchus ocellatus TaxID=259542 RepID=A0AAV3YRF1_9GAST|nr:hypothetical protein PoB_001222000 [Plakobranchus ocellatus]